MGIVTVIVTVSALERLGTSVFSSDLLEYSATTPHSLMTTDPFRLKILATCLLAVVSVPHMAPAVCGLAGRMSSPMEHVSSDGGVVSTIPQSADVCCSGHECGIATVAPAPGVTQVPVMPVSLEELSGLPPVRPDDEPAPLTPPPQL